MTQLVMPEVYDGLVKHYPSAQAWRWAFFIPGALYIVGAMIVFTLGQVSVWISRPLPIDVAGTEHRPAGPENCFGVYATLEALILNTPDAHGHCWIQVQSKGFLCAGLPVRQLPGDREEGRQGEVQLARAPCRHSVRSFDSCLCLLSHLSGHFSSACVKTQQSAVPW